MDRKMDINLPCQLDMIRTIEVFTNFAGELEYLSPYLSTQMYFTLTKTWSEAIQMSFSETVRKYYGEQLNG